MILLAYQTLDTDTDIESNSEKFFLCIWYLRIKLYDFLHYPTFAFDTNIVWIIVCAWSSIFQFHIIK